MIRQFSFIALAFSLLIVTSCQKELSFDTANNTNTTPPPTPTPTPTGNQKLYRIQQGVDPDLDNDTIWIISYDASGRIKTIVDSLYDDTLVANFDASGKLTGASDSYGDNAKYVYNSSNQLTEINYTYAGSKERFVFTYSGGTVQKKNYYSDLGSGGALQHLLEFVYTVTGGNITTVKIYTSTGLPVSTQSFTYGSDLNPFKELALLNYANRLGMDYIMDFESYFNKNLWTKATIPIQARDFSTVYTFNSQRLTKAIANDGSGGVYTWQFYYK